MQMFCLGVANIWLVCVHKIIYRYRVFININVDRESKVTHFHALKDIIKPSVTTLYVERHSKIMVFWQTNIHSLKNNKIQQKKHNMVQPIEQYKYK